MKKKQGTSGNEKKMSARNWADSVTISENLNQGGIELRFNAEPSPELQPKLRAMGFRHSKSQVMWYGENTGQAIEFARQLKGVISTSSDGPELFLSPSFDTVKTNIEKKEFSYVMISLKDGQVKNYLVFEPSKPKAEVIANNFARKEFGDQFLVLAAKPRLHVKEARILFDEGRIIFPEGQDIPTHKKSSIKGLVKTLPETSTKETSEKDKIPLREILLTTKHDNQLPLYKEGKAYSAWSGADLFVKWLIGKFSDVYYKAIWHDGETLEGSVDLEPKDFYEGKEEILSSHVQYFLGSLSKEKPNILYSTKAIEKAKKILNGYQLQETPATVTSKIDLSQVESEETGEEVISDNAHTETNISSKPEFGRLHTPEEETKIVEQFLAQGFKRPFSAQEAFDKKLPVIDLAFRYVEAMEYFRDHIENPHKEKIKKLRQDLKDLQGKVTHVKRNSLKEEIEQLETEMNFAEKLVQDESLIFQDDLFAIILQKATDKGFANQIGKDVSSFRDYVVTNVLDNRAIENYHTQPVNEVVDELIAEYFNRDENTFDMRSNPTTTPKSIATDLKSGDTFLPNVLVPSGTTEPFHSHLFQLYDMKEVIKTNFPHLLKINNDNLNSASPIAMFELIQFGHPSEYGIDVNRQELIKEWEKRGKSIFKAIGFPTDPIYPYVNLHTGYESVEPFKEMLYDNNPEGDEWWAIAEHSRPVADAKKALKIIDQMIEKEKQEMKTYLNPKTGKPKLESKHLVRDIELTIEHFEESKAVLQHYLDNPPEAGAEDKEEINEDPLANENGVYTEKTAGNNYEKIEIPMPKGAQFEASVSIVKTSKSDYVVGLHAAKKFGDSEGLAFPASVEGQSYSTREEALKYGLKFLDIRLTVLQAGKDTILGNEEKKNKQLNMAQEALKKFAEENNISLENNSATPGKISVKEIHLTTTEKKSKADYSKAIVVNNWNDANDVLRKQQWKKTPTIYFKIIWSDGETFERSLDEGNAGLYSSKRYPLSDFIYQYNLTVSKMKPLKGSSITEADVKKAKKLIEGYFFSDDGTLNKSAGIIKDLETAYWTKEDEDDESTKFVFDGTAFHALTLQERLLEEVKNKPLEKQIEIADLVSKEFKVPSLNDYTTDSKQTIRDGGLPLKKQVVYEYLFDLSNDIDFRNPQPEKTILGFLMDILINKQETLVDKPTSDQPKGSKSNAKPKKLTQLELNKSIENLIDKKDKEGSFFNEEEKNYIRQYTGSGGLIKEGAAGRGVLYEYYTPELVVKKMWEMAYHFGYDGGSILEPSVGTGNFLKYAPKGATIFGFETNHYSARIAQILFPHAHIHEKAFESLFFAGNIHLKDKFDHPLYSLVIGNPPYGEFTGKYAGMGEKQHTGATEYDQYFMLRGLDLLKKDGLLVYLIPSSFMSNGSKFNKVKEKIAAKADFMDCYRLPIRIFETTDIGTDILVLRKNK